MSTDLTEAEVDEIRRHSRAIVRSLGFLGKGLAGSTLSASAVHAIGELGRGQVRNATALAARLGLEKSTVSRLLAGLKAGGLVRAEGDAEDPRIQTLSLTPEGQAEFQRIEAYARAQVLQALAPLAGEARGAVARGLQTYAEALAPAPESRAPLSSTVILGKGYLPGLLGRVTEMHAAYYARQYDFGRVFEAKVAAGMADFLGRIEHPANQTFHATLEGRIIGAVSIDGQDLGPGLAHLRWFILDDAARGRGIGQKLLDLAMAHVDAGGFDATRLWTFKGLDAGRHLYEKAGFVLEEEAPGSQWGKEVTEQVFVRRAVASGA